MSLRDQADGFTESPSYKWDRTVWNACKVRGWLEAMFTENKWGRATPGRGSKGHSGPAGGRAGEASRPKSVCVLGTAVGAGTQRLAQGSAGQLARMAAGALEQQRGSGRWAHLAGDHLLGHNESLVYGVFPGLSHVVSTEGRGTGSFWAWWTCWAGSTQTLKQWRLFPDSSLLRGLLGRRAGQDDVCSRQLRLWERVRGGWRQKLPCGPRTNRKRDFPLGEGFGIRFLLPFPLSLSLFSHLCCLNFLQPPVLFF